MQRGKHEDDMWAADRARPACDTPPDSRGPRSSSEHSFRQRCHEGIGPNLRHLKRCPKLEADISRWKTRNQHDPSALDRVRLYPGTVGFKEDFQTLWPREVALECTISFENTIAQFVASQLEPQDALKDLVVLTGKVHKMWATTCEEYVSRTWPKISEQVMSLYERISRPQARESKDFFSLANSKSGNCIKARLKTNTVAIPTGQGPKILVTLEARRGPLMDIVEAVAWLFATASNPAELTLRFVRLEMQPGLSDLNFNLIWDHMIPASHVSSDWMSTCWMPLMKCYPVAVDFKTPTRDLEVKGIEVSFELMCFLSGLEYAAEEKPGCLVLYGPHSIVWPKRIVGSCVEWHFQAREDTFEGREEEPNEYPETCVSIDDLEFWSAQRRHFLGLWADPIVTLGSSISDPSKIEWSLAPQAPQYEYTSQGRQIGVTIAFPRILSLTWTETYAITNNRRTIYINDFDSKIRAKKNAPVLLYSVSEKRAWIVSFLSVLWHLARARCDFNKDLGWEIPPCEESADGGQAALHKILECYRLPLRRPRRNEILDDQERSMTVKDLLNQIWANLEFATRNTNRVRGFFGTKIIGYEMANFARPKDKLYLKEEKLGAMREGWTPLLEEASFVLFCEGVYDPIISNTDHRRPTICSRTLWPTIPTGFNILTASLPCLAYMSERFNRGLLQLTSNHQWHNPKGHPILGPCNEASEHTCDRLQEIKEARRGSGTAPDIAPDQPGAVVFKYATNMSTIQATYPRTVYPPPSVPTYVAPAREYPNDYAQRTYLQQSTRLRNQTKPLPTPATQFGPSSFRDHNPRTTQFTPDSGYASSSVTASPSVANSNIDRATGILPLEPLQIPRSSGSRRPASSSELQQRKQQPRPPASGAQQYALATIAQDGPPPAEHPIQYQEWRQQPRRPTNEAQPHAYAEERYHRPEPPTRRRRGQYTREKRRSSPDLCVIL
jgi:hypothetical protein